MEHDSHVRFRARATPMQNHSFVHPRQTSRVWTAKVLDYFAIIESGHGVPVAVQLQRVWCSACFVRDTVNIKCTRVRQ